jgi:hypothetical protein
MTMGSNALALNAVLDNPDKDRIRTAINECWVEGKAHEAVHQEDAQRIKPLMYRFAEIFDNHKWIVEV